MPAVYPTLPTAAGTTFSISTTPPASHDAVGFEGITNTNWETVGMVINAGGLPRAVRSYSDVSLLDGSVLVIPGNEAMEALEVEAVFQGSDTGQQRVATASDGKTIVWARWVLPSGFKVYAAGYITGYGPTVTTSETHVGCNFTFRPIFDVNKVGAVRVNPVSP